ncbi:hypothetical protein [Alkalihalobacillus sp. R86527]|uniref:hypothetical protein n=1 Tax=Alkalihalobacillus sp. R86527 TaxID=3093863 RepID=UPI00366C60D0
MDRWNEINIKGISGIDKLVAEFQIWEIATVPSGKFKVKVFENERGSFKGFTNVGMVVNGTPEFGVGSGNTIELALEDTIRNFVSEMNDKKTIKSDELTDEDFAWADPHDF